MMRDKLIVYPVFCGMDILEDVYIPGIKLDDLQFVKTFPFSEDSRFAIKLIPITINYLKINMSINGFLWVKLLRGELSGCLASFYHQIIYTLSLIILISCLA